MKFDWLLRDSVQVTVIFFVLVAIAVFTQLTKTTTLRSLPFVLRALFKAAPALFLAGLSWSLDQNLVALAFVFCAL